jgi:hypothetical protein
MEHDYAGKAVSRLLVADLFIFKTCVELEDFSGKVHQGADGVRVVSDLFDVRDAFVSCECLCFEDVI